jgi:CheY-like chemotaxis protein
MARGTPAHVQMAESAAAAREACKVQPPDIIVSDIGLPGDDRYFLIQHIRAWEAERGLQRVPALALTAFPRAEDRDHALVASYDSHMAKPVDPDRLVQQLAQLRTRAP